MRKHKAYLILSFFSRFIPKSLAEQPSSLHTFDHTPRTPVRSHKSKQAARRLLHHTPHTHATPRNAPPFIATKKILKSNTTQFLRGTGNQVRIRATRVLLQVSVAASLSTEASSWPGLRCTTIAPATHTQIRWTLGDTPTPPRMWVVSECLRGGSGEGRGPFTAAPRELVRAAPVRDTRLGGANPCHASSSATSWVCRGETYSPAPAVGAVVVAVMPLFARDCDFIPSGRG